MFFNMIVYKSDSGEPIYAYVDEDTSAQISAAMKALDVTLDALVKEPVTLAKAENVEIYALKDKCVSFIFIMDDEFLNEHEDVYSFIYALSSRFKLIYGNIIDYLYCTQEKKIGIVTDFFRGFNEVIKDFLELKAIEQHSIRAELLKESILFQSMSSEIFAKIGTSYTITYRVTNLYSRPIKLIYLRDSYPVDTSKAKLAEIYIKQKIPKYEEKKIIRTATLDKDVVPLYSISLEPLKTIYITINALAKNKKISYLRPELIFLDSRGVRKTKYATDTVVIITE